MERRERERDRMFSMHGISSGNEILRRSLSRSNTFQYVPSFIERFLTKNPRRMQNLRHKVDQTANHKLPSIRVFWFYEFCTIFSFFSIYTKESSSSSSIFFTHTSSFLNTIGLSYTKFALTFRYPN